MADYYISPQAQTDRKDIWDYIAEDNPSATDRMDKKFLDACAKLAEYPHMGHMRKDITRRSLRFWAIHSYLVVYKPETKPLEILRILSGYRDIAGIL